MVRHSNTAVASAASLPSWARIVHKGQPTDALLKRLKVLRKALTEVEQDDIQVSILDQIRKQLGQDDIMFHKNKDVRSTLACCLAELLRLYAPDCPYSDDELCVNFNFFLAVLTSSSAGLGKPSGATFGDCVALLSQLVATRAFALLCDRGISDTIVVDYFKKIFSIVKPDTPKNVEIMLSDALSLFLQYGNSVPSDVVETLIANFHPVVKQHNPAAAHLAQLIGNTAADELQTSVAQYFADGILQAAQIVDEEERESKLHGVHLLITQIARSSPALLCNVIPQLEEEMRAEDARLRLISVRTLGFVFADHTTGNNAGHMAMVRKYQGTWKIWLGRAWDKSTAVRVAWVESIKGLLSPDAESNTELLSYVGQKVADPDEKVRSAVVKTFATLDYATLRSHVPHALLQTLGERVKDKKHHIRIDALHALGRAFGLAYSDMSEGDSAAIKQFAWIPSAMIAGLLAGDLKGMLLAVQAAFEMHILPLPKTMQDTTEDAMLARLCFVMQHLDDESTNAFDLVCNLRGPRTHLHTFVEVCKDFNGGVVESSQADAIQKTLLRGITLLANHYVDPLKAGQDLHSWAKANDNRAFKLLESIMRPAADVKTIVKMRAELDKRLEGERIGVTMASFVRMASFPFVNCTVVAGLFNVLEDESGQLLRDPEQPRSKLSARIFRLLKLIASDRPAMLASHAETFRSDLHSDDVSSERRAASIMSLAKLEACSTSELAEDLTDRDVVRLAHVVENGAWNESKWAAKMLANIASNVGAPAYATAFHQAEGLCTSFVEAALHVQDSDKLVSSLIALHQITKRARDAMADSGDRIIEIILEHVLMQPYKGRGKSNRDEDWIADEELDAELNARLHAMRFLTARCIAYADHEESEEIARPVLRLLLTCLKTGETAPGLCQDPAANARMRLEASLQLLKLARKNVFDRMISVQDLQLFSTALQDEDFNVRQKVLRKLAKYMLRRSAHLPARFFVLPFLVAADPDEEGPKLVRESCAKLLSAMKADLRLRYFDAGLARFIHLVNHHPDFEGIAGSEEGYTLDKLTQAAEYFDFFLDCCVSRDNLACLYHIAGRCKGMRDSFDEERSGVVDNDGAASEGIHTLSDLFMCVIRRRAETLGTTIGHWQGQVGLPRDLYVPYASRDEQVKVLKRSYLSQEELELFQQPARRDRSATKTTATSSKRKAVSRDFAEQKSVKRGKGAKGHAAKSSKSRKTDYRSGESESGSEVADEEDDGEAESSSATTTTTTDGPISDDETVESSEDDETAGRGVRVRRRKRHEKRSRNEGRRQRRVARGIQ